MARETGDGSPGIDFGRMLRNTVVEGQILVVAKGGLSLVFRGSESGAWQLMGEMRQGVKNLSQRILRSQSNFLDWNFHYGPGGISSVLQSPAFLRMERALLSAEQGAAFEASTYPMLNRLHPTVQQLSVRTLETGTRLRLDFVPEKITRANVPIYEAKSSATAPLAINQKIGFPEIQRSGAIVIGQGKGALQGGAIIPPRQVIVIRPGDIDRLHSQSAYP